MDAGPDPIPDADADTGPVVPAAGLDDGGVLARLARRTAAIAGVMGIAVLVITATGLVWPGWFARPVGLVVGVVLIAGCTVAALVLLRRSANWTALTARTLREGPGLPAVVGAPRPLHGSRSAVLHRRVPAQVVPVRSESGPWAVGCALLTHGRADGFALRAGDEVLGRWQRPRGPYLLERTDDGAIFAAERSTLGVW